MKMRSAITAAIILLLPAAANAAAAAKGGAVGAERRYQNCMAQVGTDAHKALRSAEDWQNRGGGDAARHCAAAAEMELGRYAQAAGTLDTLAGETTAVPVLRASLFGQAAHAWLAADEPKLAEASATNALTLVPGDTGLLLLRARALAGQRRFADAITDLDQAITIDPQLADAYVYRASAMRQDDALVSAELDLDKALALDPQHPEALLERGILRRIKGDDAGARDDWQALVAAAPKSPAAEQARLNLERMKGGG
jgi:tetratricopeptide (TPR) repeat protein